MSERLYTNANNYPCTLDSLVKTEPEWAANQIRHRDRLEDELAAAIAERDRLRDDKQRLMLDNASWESTVNRITDERDSLKRQLIEATAKFDAMKGCKLDEFACAALTGLLAHIVGVKYTTCAPEAYAARAYVYANAMMEERSKQP